VSDVERLLTLVNGAALHKALREQGVGVSYRTVARWIGATPSAQPPADLVPVLEAVFGIQKEAEPPDWATRLEAKVDSIHARQDTIMERQAEMADSASRQVIEVLGSPELLEWAQRIGERTAAPPSQSGEGSGGRSGGSVPGTRVLRDPEP
jgi:hypothetical protein